MKKKKQKRLAVWSILVGTIGVLVTIVGIFIRRRQMKEVKFRGRKRLLYPQDLILDKTVLKLIPDYIFPTYFSVLRIILTPFAAYYVVYGRNLWIALLIYLFVSFTDTIDGALARTRGQITELGKIIDPIADKLLFITTGILLLPRFGALYLLIIILSMELMAVVLGYFFFRQKADMAANIFGKIKLLLQISGIIFFVIANHTFDLRYAHIGYITLIISIIFHLVSIGSFLYSIN